MRDWGLQGLGFRIEALARVQGWNGRSHRVRNQVLEIGICRAKELGFLILGLGVV